MEKQLVTFRPPFEKLRHDKYLLLEVLMHLDYTDALIFMHNANNATRKFLGENYTTVKNEFVNEGLITHKFFLGSFQSY